MSVTEDRAWLQPILRLGWVSFFADVASEMVYPAIPLFVVQVLKAPIQALGFIEGCAEALVSFMKGWSGWHFDRTGRRLPFIQWGYGLSAIGKPIIAVAPGWTTVLFGRLTDRFGKGIRTTARDALIADAAGRDRLGKAYGLHRGMDTAGAFVGVSILILLLSLNWGYRAIFAAAVVPGLISLYFTFTVKDVRPQQGPSQGTIKSGIRLRDLPAPYWRALALSCVFALANSSDTFLLLYGNQIGMSPTAVVFAYLLYNLTYTLLSYPAGALSDRIGRWGILGIGWCVYATVYGGFAHLTGSLIWVLFALYGCYMGLTQGVTKALVASHSPDRGKGTALGLFFMVSGFATLIGNLGCAVLWGAFGPGVMFTTCAVVAVGSAILIPLTAQLERAKPA